MKIVFFQPALQDLARCQNYLDEVKQNMKKYATKLAKFKVAAQASEKSLAEL